MLPEKSLADHLDKPLQATASVLSLASQVQSSLSAQKLHSVGVFRGDTCYPGAFQVLPFYMSS